MQERTLSIESCYASLAVMEITARQIAPDVYAVNFDDTEIILEGLEIKHLLIEVMKVLDPGDLTAKEGNPTQEFVRDIKTANDVGIQKLLLVAEHDDLLVLLKHAESDPDLQNKFFSNMSENNRKVFEEDMNYQFTDEIPEPRVLQSISRLIDKAKDLEMDDILTYGRP